MPAIAVGLRVSLDLAPNAEDPTALQQQLAEALAASKVQSALKAAVYRSDLTALIEPGSFRVDIEADTEEPKADDDPDKTSQLSPADLATLRSYRTK